MPASLLQLRRHSCCAQAKGTDVQGRLLESTCILTPGYNQWMESGKEGYHVMEADQNILLHHYFTCPMTLADTFQPGQMQT
jgi:hypothetical protein